MLHVGAPSRTVHANAPRVPLDVEVGLVQPAKGHDRVVLVTLINVSTDSVTNLDLIVQGDNAFQKTQRLDQLAVGQSQVVRFEVSAVVASLYLTVTYD